MTKSEKAWKPVNDTWHPYAETRPSSPAVGYLRDTIRRLQEIRLPILAIDLIGQAIRQAEQAALESSECENCGVRSDGTVECIKCHKRVDHCEADGITGTCLTCQDEMEDEALDEEAEENGVDL